MSNHPIRVDRAADADRYLATDQLVWSAEVRSAPTEVQLTGVEPRHRFAAEAVGADPATYPGIYGVYPMTLAVPGPDAGRRQVPCAGLTWVGVHPDHRRRGVLSAMLRHHFEQVHADGGHLSALHASEPAIYGRHGYGLAAIELQVRVGRGTELSAPHLEDAAVTTRMATVTDPGIPARLRACHLAHAEVGAVVGEHGYYERVCLQLPEDLRGKEPWRVLFAQRDGVDVGFTLFRRAEKWERARPAGEVEVWTVVGEPAARLALLRRLVDLDLMATVKVGTVGVDDPLLSWTGGPRGASDVGMYDGLWVRLVDLPGALAARTWSAPCDVVVEVADRAAPWNDGAWRIHADAAGVAAVERSSAEPDLSLDVAVLGAAYLGGGNLVTAHRAGLLAEHRPGAVREVWRGLRTEVAPTAAVGF
ncbi:GNAT family N-acetyltransferase [Nocardioides sp. T2.26MG-1]|uniref:GNAT family N-acetyltransferase n=1 Tax=Nocardioides sp. T2.26MG-1 TaxID=3041166 RepID=UPI0024776577|nr:GNAT family N-acetyltransferase [Nocardioides sp. T2.26MG-1]CAI9419141.1 N-acetyltransferase Eis [Nocardioides sp. T2.26MG-1]